MQYKIPVQIENEDPIMLWLSLRQLLIIVTWFGIAYGVFKRLESNIWSEVALIPTIIIVVITLTIALFKNSEMTFVPFMLSFLRYKLNTPERIWKAWVDSFSPIDIGYLNEEIKIEKDDVNLKNKIEKMKELESKLEKI